MRSSGSRRSACVSVAFFCVMACALAVGVSRAAAEAGQFGEEGSGAGQFVEPGGVALDQTGNVYIVDRGNLRVDKFGATGDFLTAWGWGVADGTTTAFQTCTTECFAGIEGAGAGQLGAGAQGVAVDNSTNPLDMSVGDVYVVDVRNQRVEKFSPFGTFLLMFGGEVNEATKGDVCLAGEKCQAGSPGTANGQFEIGSRSGDYIAVGPTGAVYVGDQDRVQKFSPEGVYQSQITLVGGSSPNQTIALAVDSAEHVYVKSAEVSGVQEYDSAGALINTLDSAGFPQALALDASGDLFIDDGEDFAHHILEYDPSGNELSSFDSGLEGGSRGIAFGDAAGALYVLNKGVVRLVTPPPPGPLVEPGSASATEVLPTAAMLQATVNPEGHETTYHFDYGPTPSYGVSTPESASIGASFEGQSASAPLSGLQPRTTYHFRVVATNSAGTNDGPDQTFTTLPPAKIDSESASKVTSISATLGAKINPLGLDTKYTFEYGPNASYGKQTPVPEVDIGSGTSDVTVARHVQELTPSTVYHYRVVAHNGLGTAEGPDRTFATQPLGASPQLPDGRAWELVSPADKHGATIEAFNFGGAAIQASEDGGAISYAANAPTEADPPGTLSPERVQVLSRRGAGGWESRDIATPHQAPTAEIQAGHESEYKLFSPDLSLGIVEAPGETLLSPEASERTPYLRENAADSYRPLVTAANVPPGTKFGGDHEAAVNEVLNFVSAAPDLGHAVLTSTVPLTSAPITGLDSLYEWGGGQLQLVSVLPRKPNGEPGEPAPQPFLGNHGGPEQGVVRHAISNDGSRVIWGTPEHLYMRDMSRGETVQIDAAQGAPEPQNGQPRFQTASGDGSRVFFTDEQRLTADSKPGNEAPDLYEYETTAGGAGRLHDLTVDHNAREHAAVQGVLPGASEDGSYVYLVAKGVLASAPNANGEKAEPEGNNLYVLHETSTEWTTTFIAQLSREDANDWEAEAGLNHSDFVALTSRVSPHGRWLAFMSERSLTGYDNLDSNSQQLDEEVFLYDASSARLVCASCNPSGARPVGLFSPAEPPGPLGDAANVWKGRWLAALIPGWTPIALDHALYQSRYLSDSGRLFFDSFDPLVSQDNNGKADVYEYEPSGVGDCARESACVALISSGISAEESTFLDASESGDDVFFLTAAHLVPEARGGSLDLYDAHVCSAAAPCLPPSPTSQPACTSADACRAAPSLQPPLLEPPSATLSGAGNIVQPDSKPKPKSKQAKCKRGFVRKKVKSKRGHKKVKGKTRCVRQRHKAHRAGRAIKSAKGSKR
jgi:hypothetical protein